MIAPALEVNTAARKEIVCELDPSVRVPPKEGETGEAYRLRHAALYSEYLRSGDESALRLDGKETRFVLRPLSRSELRFLELDATNWATKGRLAYHKATRAKAFEVGCLEAFDTVDGKRQPLDLERIPFMVQEEIGTIIWNWSTQVDGPFAARTSQSSGDERGSSTLSQDTPKPARKAGPKKTKAGRS
jgi:hypothetical protein